MGVLGGVPLGEGVRGRPGWGGTKEKPAQRQSRERRDKELSLTWLSRRVLRKQRGLDNKGAAGAETRGIPPPPF